VQRNSYAIPIPANILGIALIFGGAVLINEFGILPKWQAALLGTVAPFWYATWLLHRRWKYVTFWMCLMAWLGIHLIIVWFLFRVILSSVRNVEVFLWVPIAAVETLILYMGIGGLEQRWRRQKHGSSNRACGGAGGQI
jgi:hypothetical protein